MESELRKSACYNKVGTGESPLLTILGRMPVLGILPFLHTGVQLKYVSKLTDAQRTSRESLPNSIVERHEEEICHLAANGAHGE